MIDIKGVLLQWFITFLIINQHPLDLATRELAEDLHKPIIRKFEKRKVNSSLIDNIWVLILLICN